MIPFYRPWTSGQELQHIAQAIAHQAGPEARHYTLACERWLQDHAGSLRAYLTPSCTAALEMAAILAGIQPGDEVIMPSFTFPAMANAFVLRGGIPVFVDIRADTFNLDERLVEAAITPRTRAIVAMHYGGVACEMDTLMAIAAAHGLLVIEDAAHALGASYKGRPLGSIGHLGAYSFHKTKNLQCGEGGALLVNDARFLARAEIVREHGTNRASFMRGDSRHYSWKDLGSSFILSEFSAAFLWAQLTSLGHVLASRRDAWQHYHERLGTGAVPGAEHNAHIYPLLADSGARRAALQTALLQQGIQASPHYEPLHSSQAGQRFGRVAAPLPVTEAVAASLLRLPLWVGLSRQDIERVCSAITALSPVPAPAAVL